MRFLYFGPLALPETLSILSISQPHGDGDRGWEDKVPHGAAGKTSVGDELEGATLIVFDTVVWCEVQPKNV